MSGEARTSSSLQKISRCRRAPSGAPDPYSNLTDYGVVTSTVLDRTSLQKRELSPLDTPKEKRSRSTAGAFGSGSCSSYHVVPTGPVHQPETNRLRCTYLAFSILASLRRSASSDTHAEFDAICVLPTSLPISILALSWADRRTELSVLGGLRAGQRYLSCRVRR